MIVFKLLLNGTSVEVANERDVSVPMIVLNGGPAAVAAATVVSEMGMTTGMRWIRRSTRSPILGAKRNASSARQATWTAGSSRCSFSAGVSPCSAIEKRSKL